MLSESSTVHVTQRTLKGVMTTTKYLGRRIGKILELLELGVHGRIKMYRSLEGLGIPFS